MEKHPPERFWTAASIDALAERFGLPNDPDMQDWPFQVADPARIVEFISAFAEFEGEPDIRYTLMDLLLQSFEEFDGDLRTNETWHTILTRLERDFAIHAYQVWYWSALDHDPGDTWRVSAFLREIWRRKKSEI